MVDGEYKDVKRTTYEIKVKGRDLPEIVEVLETHRGPVLTPKILQGSPTLANSVPVHADVGALSLAWSGHTLGESFLRMNILLTKSENLNEF